MISIIEPIKEIPQGWVLTFLSSVMCIFGALIIFTDDLIWIFNKRSTFSIKNNESFLVYGFSVSSGSLIFTSLYKLLPKSYNFFTKVDEFTKPSLYVSVTFLGGIAVCMVLNSLIHRFTSQSIVHCSHDGHSHHHDEESGDTGSHEHGEHSHEHSHSDSHEPHSLSHDSKEHQHDINKHSHSHSHSQTSSSSSSDENNNDLNVLIKANIQKQVEPTIQVPEEYIPTADECTALLKDHPTLASSDLTNIESHSYDSIKRKKSTIQLVLNNLKNNKNDCKGIYDECCDGLSDCDTDVKLAHKMTYDLHNLDVYRGFNENSKVGSTLVAYTHLENGNAPSSSPMNVLLNKSQSSLEFNLLPPNHVTIKTEPDLKRHVKHKDDHHHKVNTPISKLLSIGLQTCLALTLHKFPEGFITYVTSEADPKLGVSIFLSLAIHNIIEGFTMILPLYLALNSKLKAFAITFVLGGLSQPVGAVLAYWTLSGKNIDKENSYLVFGALMGITCGFLTVISLQLLISAINFGGSSNSVTLWCVVGMCIILASSILTEL